MKRRVTRIPIKFSQAVLDKEATIHLPEHVDHVIVQFEDGKERTIEDLSEICIDSEDGASVSSFSDLQGGDDVIALWPPTNRRYSATVIAVKTSEKPTEAETRKRPQTKQTGRLRKKQKANNDLPAAQKEAVSARIKAVKNMARKFFQAPITVHAAAPACSPTPCDRSRSHSPSDCSRSPSPRSRNTSDCFRSPSTRSPSPSAHSRSPSTRSPSAHSRSPTPPACSPTRPARSPSPPVPSPTLVPTPLLRSPYSGQSSTSDKLAPCQSCSEKDHRILTLEQEVKRLTADLAAEKMKNNQNPPSRADHYKPTTGLQIEKCEFKILSAGKPAPPGYVILAEGHPVAVPIAWFSTVGAKTNRKEGGFFVKAIMSGMFEPTDVGERGGICSFTGWKKSVMEAIRAFAVRDLKMTPKAFVEAANQKLSTMRRGVRVRVSKKAAQDPSM